MFAIAHHLQLGCLTTPKSAMWRLLIVDQPQKQVKRFDFARLLLFHFPPGWLLNSSHRVVLLQCIVRMFTLLDYFFSSSVYTNNGAVVVVVVVVGMTLRPWQVVSKLKIHNNNCKWVKSCLHYISLQTMVQQYLQQLLFSIYFCRQIGRQRIYRSATSRHNCTNAKSV